VLLLMALHLCRSISQSMFALALKTVGLTVNCQDHILLVEKQLLALCTNVEVSNFISEVLRQS
jgi:hypothetical protein